MIRYIAITILTLCVVLQKSTAQSVKFYNGSIYKALQEIKGTQKYIIMELYAPWNYKSKWMHSQLENALNNINPKEYLVVSIDTQTEEGSKLAQLYGVSDYPAIVVFNSRGDALSMLPNAMMANDFCNFLVSIKMQEDRNAVGELSKIYKMVDKVSQKELQENVEKYLKTQPLEYILLEEHFELFASNIITKYNSPSYWFLIENQTKFFSKTIAMDNIERCLWEEIIPVITGVVEKDKGLKVIKKIEADTISLKLFPDIKKIIELANLRLENNPTKYILKLQSVAENLPQKYEFQIVTSIEFTAKLLKPTDRDSRRIVTKILENLAQKSHSNAKMTMIKEILDKF